MINSLNKYSIILGSGSPRRSELLESLGLKFEVKLNGEVDESYSSNLETKEVAEFLANKKANSYGKLNDKELLITADTVVIHKNKILGKPKDYDEAKKMLRCLSGEKHLVTTGVCLKSNEKTVSFSISSEVWFKHLTVEEINYYIENYKPYDKAGAYGIQEWIGLIGVKEIAGSYYNVMGLPVQKLYEEIQQF